jgi:hypothetical protein
LKEKIKKQNMKNIKTFVEFLNEARMPWSTGTLSIDEKKLMPENQEKIDQYKSMIENIQDQLKNWPSGNKGADKSKRAAIKEIREEIKEIKQYDAKGEIWPYDAEYPDMSY